MKLAIYMGGQLQWYPTCRREKENTGAKNLLATSVVVAILGTLCFPGGFSVDTDAG